MINVTANFLKEMLIAYALQDDFCIETYKKLSGTDASLENRIVCSAIINESIKHKVKPIRALSVAWAESRITSQLKPNRSKCIGPLQIKIKYWCKEKSLYRCEPISDGVKALKYYIDHFKPIRKAYCFYNDARKPECKTDYMSDYVKKVVKTYGKIKNIAVKIKYKSLNIL
jgi:hypothetical protein